MEKRDNTSCKPLIFISWSKPQGKEVATILKDFLMEVLHLKSSSDIFLSTQNIQMAHFTEHNQTERLRRNSKQLKHYHYVS